MKQNTHSLLSSAWHISDAASSALIPALISMVKGAPIAKAEPEVITRFGMLANEGDDSEPTYNVVEDMRNDARYIPVLSIKSTIFKYDQECGPRGTKSMMGLMKEWEGNDSVMGVVLDFDSGGGQASGTREFAHYIYNYPKPVLSFSDGGVGSAALWLALAAKGGFIISPNADYAGCIGTMWKHVNLEGILRNQGAVIEDIYPPESPRKNEESRALAKGNHTPLITNILSPGANLFKGDLKIFRPQMNEEVYDGAIYPPLKAVEMGIADRTGTLSDCFNEIVKQSKTPNKKVQNQNSTNMTTKQRASVQAALNLGETPLAVTDNGSYLNESQLDALEAAMANNATAVQTATAAQTAAETATTQAQDDLAAAALAHTTETTALSASVDAMVTAAGITATGTTQEKLTALSGHYATINASDGAVHTIPRTSAAPAADTPKYVDANAGHNQIANSIFQ